MRQFPTRATEMVATLWRHRELVTTATKREILGRYRGSMLGLLWSFFNPLLMLGVYTFVFSEIFKARWGSGTGSKSEFALILFAGLIIFNLFTECINRAPSLITANVNYVKKVVFPLEILPAVTLISALFHGTISLAVWLLAYWALFGTPHLTALYFPLILFPLMMLTMGLSWLLAATGVFLRDITHVVTIITSVLMFLSPIFYPLTALPEAYRPILYANPLTIVIEQTRAVLFFGETPDPLILCGYWLMSFFIAWAGFAWFQKTRKGFADVL
ncbi:ABC transporter permease [Marichromatium bheemlicum]|uniref:Transport permease protein n=1 Tax=Marichromatium bheemlicum TaxID=365339 RepID=A0ABX1I633_9GAMM|nr:ABC transporter permease [Marichromatium bheemlicum]NKN32748.1 ABC transporter permease [Marichromatium bheemlicum]